MTTPAVVPATESLTAFNTWKRNYITTKVAGVAKINPDTLVVDNFLKLTTFDPVRKVDIVKERAEKLFVDILVNFQIGQGFQALGITVKPTTHPDFRYFTAAQVTFIKAYSKLWLLQCIYHHPLSGNYRASIKAGKIEDDMTALSPNPFFARIMMMFYMIALADLVPDMLQYIYHYDKFNTRVRNQLLSPAATNKFVQDTITLLYNSEDNNLESEFDSYRFFELKTKLDLLQPNFLVSNDILSQYYYSTIAFLTTGNLTLDMIYPEQLFNAITEYVVTRIDSNESSSLNDLIGEMKVTIEGGDGTLATLALKLGEFIFNFVEKQSKDLRAICSVETVDTQANAVPITKEHVLDSVFSAYANNTNFVNFLNGLYDSCHVCCVIYAIQNYEDIEEFDKEKIDKSESTYFTRYSSAIPNKKVFIVMADFIRGITRNVMKDPTKILSGFQSSFSTIYSDTIGFHLNRLLPAIYILAKDYQTYEVLTNGSDQAVIPSLAIPFNDLHPTLVGQLGYFLKSQSFSSFSTIDLGINIYGLTLLKYIEELLTETITSYVIQSESTKDPNINLSYVSLLPIDGEKSTSPKTDIVNYSKAPTYPVVNYINNYINILPDYKSTYMTDGIYDPLDYDTLYYSNDDVKDALNNIFGLNRVEEVVTTEDFTIVTDDGQTIVLKDIKEEEDNSNNFGLLTQFG
ncbi:hypothetical protein DLAC_03313 [Tieghemostelium lacteum]|uniref:Uncharacterized protein n=1 Tax=Tieghemostelium lacteum TaxID=361077 RepID=A0A152A1S1_TIELA|nr:hypothetical protein DLAC_03313 [Tieghemostelium lacteum]|eukprot:KYR00160.1 hypothetical protein DLAC_03313 [Tieghemostelium lacteum]